MNMYKYTNVDIVTKILSMCFFACEEYCEGICSDMQCLSINMVLRGEY